MKFISWTLNEPSNAQFAEYATEVSPGEWRILNPDAWKNWGGNQKNFWLAFMNHHDKIYGVGLHDFGVNADGTIYSYKAGEGYPVLNEDETAIRWWMRDSLRFWSTIIQISNGRCKWFVSVHLVWSRSSIM